MRLETVSLLAGIDLLTGEAIPLVSKSHKSSDFVNFLKILDKKYPEGDTVRLIPDNYSAHKSKETYQLKIVLKVYEYLQNAVPVLPIQLSILKYIQCTKF